MFSGIRSATYGSDTGDSLCTKGLREIVYKTDHDGHGERKKEQKGRRVE